MSQSTSGNNDPGKFNKLLTGRVDQSIKARLPRAGGSPPPLRIPAASAETGGREKKPSRFKFGPAFWTFASVVSLTVNVVLLAAALVGIRMLGGLSFTPQDQLSSILGGLYLNFVKMDQAHIRTNIHVEKEIPVNFVLNVSGPTTVRLSQDVVIDGALVTVETGGLNIVNARARIVLPVGTPLPVTIEGLIVPVDQKVLAVLDVPVDIPLDQTELHEPFVGLRMVVEPFYCLLEPNTVINGVNVCSPISDIQNNPEQLVP
jgi:hypothetical protein